MPNSMKNMVLITGGSRGIGKEMARRLVADGHEVIILGREADALSRASQEVGATGWLVADLGRLEGIEEVVMEAERRFPGLNVLVNNAGIQQEIDFAREAIPLARLQGEVHTNLLAPLWLTTLLLPRLAGRPRATVVNVGSALAFSPRRAAPVYCATKAALHSLSVSLRAQLAPMGIRVLELIPPQVATSMAAGRGKGLMDPARVAEALAKALDDPEREEVVLGQARMVRPLLRLAPGWVRRKMMES